MKVEIKEPKSWQRIFEIEVPSQQLNEAIEELYQEYGRKAKIPGFRPGKVPRTVLEARFGKGIEAEAIERLVPESYEKALLENKLVPVNRAVISDMDITGDKVLKFKATFEVLPTVTLKKYKGLSAAKRLREVTDEDVAREIEFLQNIYAEYNTVDRASAKGDRVIIDFKPISGVEDPEKSKGENYTIDLGAAQVLPEFNDNLTGVKAGDVKEISVQYKDDYQAQELAGKTVVFQVTVKEVKEKKQPELNDDFAKKVSEYQTIGELREKIKSGMIARAESEAMEGVRIQAVNALIDENPVELPESLVKEQTENMVAEAKERHLRQHNHPDKKDCPECGWDQEKMLAQYKPAAEWKIKEDLFLSQVVKAENIQAEPNEIEEAIEDWARHNRTDPAEIRKVLQKNPERMDDLKDRLAANKAGQMLAQWAEVKLEKVADKK
ncbi:MAG: trigger factor [Candidatus Edwardsbacteria bacterium]|nr:trigger factor [Candidatus Edwardsbacteria bacterium]MBU1577708.1 trigger factor [Candidatus Edwardsbacteria bacterium]MBU2463871.1 trigger factor [Candidatus Edwardsbacteria bacterium]MBU2594344.1 trigger factor [Candidatus Edwardsbacteria bacterium]